jgi:hypothetical protein
METEAGGEAPYIHIYLDVQYLESHIASHHIHSMPMPMLISMQFTIPGPEPWKQHCCLLPALLAHCSPSLARLVTHPSWLSEHVGLDG